MTPATAALPTPGEVREASRSRLEALAHALGVGAPSRMGMESLRVEVQRKLSEARQK